MPAVYLQYLTSKKMYAVIVTSQHANGEVSGLIEAHRGLKEGLSIFTHSFEY